jgi:hypothetical protein
MSFCFRTTLPIQSYKIKLEALYQLILRLVNQKISIFGLLAHLTNFLDYGFEALSQFMNLGVFFYFRMTLPIQAHKTKLEALCQLILRLVNQKISGFGPFAHLTDLLNY